MNKNGNIHLALNDIVAYGNFFKVNYHTACLVASRYIQDNQEIEDIVQDVFIKIWERRSELQIHTSLKNYLFNSVKNSSINYVSRKKEIAAELIDNGVYLNDDEGKNPFVSEEFASEIDRAIMELPPRCQKIFLLAYINNLTYQEIADALGVSKNTVKTQMGIAYKFLREKLRDSFFNLITIFLGRKAKYNR